MVKVAHPAVSGGLNLTYGTGGTYGGFDNFGRIVDQKWQDDTPNTLDRYTYGYDRNSNRLYRRNEVESTLSELYHAENPTAGTEYDGLNRLVEFHRGTLDNDKDGIASDDSGAQLWSLDALGNWSEFKDDATDGGTWDLDQDRTHNKVNEITDLDANWVDPAYDAAGNMIYGPRPGAETSTTEDLVMVWDAWNRLAAVYADDGTSPGEKDDDDTPIAEYRYDGQHRRIAKIVPDPGNQGKFVRTDFYYTASWQLVEERQDDNLASKDTVASTLKYQYVWGLRYIDAPICRDEDTSGDGDCTDAKTDADPGENTGDEHLYYCQDANFNVTALVDDYDGAVVERYMYSPYGQPEVLHGDRDSSGTDTSADEWSARTSNTFENEILYCGYRFDSETGLYHVRRRYYVPPLGRWLSRDPIGYVDGMGLYEYVACRPTVWIDPFGRQGFPDFFGMKERAEREAAANKWGYPGPITNDSALYRRMIAYNRVQCARGLAWLQLMKGVEAHYDAMTAGHRQGARTLEGVSQGASGIPESGPVGLLAEGGSQALDAFADKYYEKMHKARRAQKKACLKYIIPYCCPDVAKKHCAKYMGPGN